MRVVEDWSESVKMQMTDGTGADQSYLAHPRNCPITILAGAASAAKAKLLLTPSLSELSALEGMGPLSAIVVTCLGYSQGNAIQGGIDRLCNWASLLGRACTRKGKL